VALLGFSLLSSWLLVSTAFSYKNFVIWR
jgi:hypothetical protein